MLELLFLFKALLFAALMAGLFVVYPVLRRRWRKRESMEGRARAAKEENAR